MAAGKAHGQQQRKRLANGSCAHNGAHSHHTTWAKHTASRSQQTQEETVENDAVQTLGCETPQDGLVEESTSLQHEAMQVQNGMAQPQNGMIWPQPQNSIFTIPQNGMAMQPQNGGFMQQQMPSQFQQTRGHACCSSCQCFAKQQFSNDNVFREQTPARGGFTAEQWEAWMATPEGQQVYRWWADWIPTPEGVNWSANKRYEAKLLVDAMIRAWGLETLRAGAGVVEIGGDPGFVASELLCHGIPATLVDPAFGMSGKANSYSQDIFMQWDSWPIFSSRGLNKPAFNLVQEPFDEVFMQKNESVELLAQASAIVSLYPDEVTDFVLRVSVEHNLRTAVIPCNECAQFFPPRNPTYEGFVEQLLEKDYMQQNALGGRAPLQRSVLCGSPFCQVLLHRSPWQTCSRNASAA